jgi:imidazolonepropionase-like amidohydrolase
MIRIGFAGVIAFAFLQPFAAQNNSAQPTFMTGARIIDGTGRAAIERGDIVIRNGRIESVGPTGTLAVPAGAARIDVTGKTIIPGLINAHAHVEVDENSTLPVREQLAAQLKVYSDYGITTIYSLGDDGVESIRLRDDQRRGTPDRARLYVSGGSVVAPTVEEARRAIDASAAKKVDVIKTRVDGPDNSPQRMSPPVYTALIDQAHKHGLRVAAHMFFLKDARGLVDAGVDILAHSVRDQDIDAALINEMKRRNVGYIPTLTRDLSVFVYESTPAFFSDPFFTRQAYYRPLVPRLTDPAAQARVRNNANAQAIKKALVQANRNLKMLQDAGVTVAMGTDTGAGLGRWQGYFEHVELEMMVTAGLTPMQVLVAATGNAAKVTKLDAELGTLQPGKWADLIVLNANPLADIRNTRQMDSVWIAGRRLGN